jgi:ribosomal protein S24E
MKIKTEFKNDLLNRREVVVLLDSESNPGFENVTKLLAEKFKSDVAHVVVKGIRNNYGSKEFVIESFIYDSAEHKHKTERKKKVKAEAKK